MKFNHFSLEEREKIREVFWQKASIRTTAKTLNQSPSSVSREINRTGGLRMSYLPRCANNRALANRTHRHDLRRYLKRRHKYRVKQGMRKGARVFRPKGPCIDERPKEIEGR